MRKLLLSSLVFFGCFSGVDCSEKIYINHEDVALNQEVFRIHTGHNEWIESKAMHSDGNGIYVFESDINRAVMSKGLDTKYEKMWKCPYCYHFWPIGTPCQNSLCPSKYK